MSMTISEISLIFSIAAAILSLVGLGLSLITRRRLFQAMRVVELENLPVLRQETPEHVKIHLSGASHKGIKLPQDNPTELKLYGNGHPISTNIQLFTADGYIKTGSIAYYDGKGNFVSEPNKREKATLKYLLQQDDAAPDSLWYFKKQLKEKFDIDFDVFMRVTTQVQKPDDPYIAYQYKDWVMFIAFDDPYYALIDKQIFWDWWLEQHT